MAKEIFTLCKDGQLVINMEGFTGDACLKHADLVRKEMEALGVTSDVAEIRMHPRPPEQVHDAEEKETLKIGESGK